MYKVEYWQFYGHSHDFELPSYALPLIAVGSPAACVFELGFCAILYPLLASQGSNIHHAADHDGGFMNRNGPPQGPPLHKQWQWQGDTTILPFRPKDGGPY